jgi:hypothetical protein
MRIVSEFQQCLALFLELFLTIGNEFKKDPS